MNATLDISIKSLEADVSRIIEQYGRDKEAVIPILQALQKRHRYLPEEAMRMVCEQTDITPADIIGVSTFYDQFRHKPVGRHMISVCHGTACHVKDAQRITDALRRHLHLDEENDTDPDGMFTLQKVACLGCCTLAPAVQIDEVTYGHLKPERIPGVLEDFLAREETRIESKNDEAPMHETGQTELRIGLGSCCVSRGSGKLLDSLQDAMRRLEIDAKIKHVGCVGMCHQTPLLEVVIPGETNHLYACVQPEDAEGILMRHFKPRSILKTIQQSLNQSINFLLSGEDPKPVNRLAIHLHDKPVNAFLHKQKNIATEYCGQINPLDLDEYKFNRGFIALEVCLKQNSPEDVIGKIQQSGLRGRGGGGYPTGIKWAKVREQNETPYIVCNGDEGDPGAFMDRMLMESYPYRVIEGMIIAAFASGAKQGYFYIRAEYPLAVQRIREALNRCRSRGYLGENIRGSGFSLELEVREGAGAFVCGEETALLASLEGQRGMPRLRPPYPAQSGLRGKPTLINNVETYSLVPAIIREGAEAFAKLGTETSKGTKVFALAGKVARGGLIEVPMGIRLKEVVEDIGGGVLEGRTFKAVQVGGPSGGCIPAALADVPIDYESLARQGAIMGSGGLVVLDNTDCMVDIARYFMEFAMEQSCGKCTFCRIGTIRMLDILERLCAGTAKRDDLEKLEHLAEMVKVGSLCGLGKTAPNPVLTTLNYFREEYEAHLEGRCPAGKCSALFSLDITNECVGCTLCSQQCPTDAIPMTPYERHAIIDEKCVRCGTCINICPANAIRKV